MSSLRHTNRPSPGATDGGTAREERATPTAPAGPARTCAVFAALWVVLVVPVAVAWAPLMSFDRTVADSLHDLAVAEPAVTQANRILTDWVWDPWTMRLLAAVAVVWLWFRHDRLLAVWVAVTSTVATGLQQAVKAVLDRERPSWPDPVDSAHYAAFPSGHAMTAVVTCGLLLWLARRRGVAGPLWGSCVAVAAVSVAGVGFTRLYLGVHWATDVVGGWVLGVFVVALAVALYERLALSRGR